MTLPLISGYAAAFLGIMQIFLMVPVGNARRKYAISIGDNGNEELLYKMRRHGNFTENAPIFIILLALLEIAGGAPMTVISLAVIFIVTRLSHAYAISGSDRPAAARILGALGTMIGIMGSSLALIYQLSMM